MPRKNTKRKPHKQRPNAVVNELRKLNLAEHSQIKAGIPEVRDVGKIVVSRQQITTFQRTYTGPTIIPSTTVDFAGALSFALNSLPNYTEFTALFDQYRIIQAVVRFVPTSQVSTSTPLLTVLDYDDASVPSAVTDVQQYATLQITESGGYCERVLNPHPATAMYSGAFTSFGSPSGGPRGPWIDSASPGVLYYGLKYYNLAQTGNNTSINWDTTITLVFQCKYLR